MTYLRLWAGLLALAACSPSSAVANETTEKPTISRQQTLTMEKAVQLGLARSPRLKMFQNSRAAASGELRQAGVLRNPELYVNSQYLAASRAYRTINPRQTFYGLSEVVETGGKVSKRERIASSGVLIADLEYQAAALDLIHDITIAYAEAVAAQEGITLATEQKELAKEMLDSIAARVNAAAAPLIQQNRAEVQLSVAEIAYDKAVRDRESTRKVLAALLGENKLSAVLTQKSFYSLTKPEKRPATSLPETSPDLARQEQLLVQSRHRLSLERANALPDPRIDVGVTEINATNGRALTVGLALPIPVFNANHGNIDAARYHVARAAETKRETTYLLGVELEKASQRMQNAYTQATMLKTKIIPSAEQSFKLAREGYLLGRFLYLDVLDTQRGLFEAKQQYIEALREYHAAKAGVERLTAKHLGLLATKGDTHAEE